MKIGMVLKQTFPPDIRVEKEARALLAAGQDVHLLAYSRGGKEPVEEEVDGLRVRRISREQRRWSTPTFLWNAVRFSFAFNDRYWEDQIERFTRDRALDVLHIHDLPLVGTAVTVGRRLGIPVVADLHENMPAALRIGRTSFPFPRRAMLAVFRNERLWRRYEQRILPCCARIIVVVPEAAERLSAYGIPHDRVGVVSNTEDETTFHLGQPIPEIVERYRGLWVVSYVGGIGPHRGVDTAIRAVPLAAPYIPNLYLLIVGVKKETQARALAKLIHQAGAEAHVKVLGWQPFHTVSSYVAVSTISLVPHNDCEHTQTTVPHKLFQAMLAGKPVVVSDVRPLRRIVEETQSGLVFKANDPASLADTLIRLYRNPELVRQLGHNGYQAATGPYAWRHDARRLVELYHGLEESRER